MIEKLFGVWNSDPLDPLTLEQYGNVTLEFKPDGQLIYTIHEKGSKQYIFLEYEVAENRLITNQPSTPEREETVFTIHGNRLELYFNGDRSCYIRVMHHE